MPDFMVLVPKLAPKHVFGASGGMGDLGGFWRHERGVFGVSFHAFGASFLRLERGEWTNPVLFWLVQVFHFGY